MELFRRVPFLVAMGVVAGAIAPAGWGCGGGGYVYAGLVGNVPVAGVGARITPTPQGFQVLSGHTAGWVGVGGPGQGPNGTDEWIQVGFSAFPDWTGNDLYYEVARPGSAPTYRRVLAGLPAGEGMRVSVLEMHRQRDWWRVWVDGSPVSAPIYVPASHGRLRPVMTAESWDGGQDVCNDFLYEFDAIRIATRSGGTWSPLGATTTIDDADTVVLRRAPDVFDGAGGPLARRALASASAGTDG